FVTVRRQHTKSTRDWSSDVCSSDLDLLQVDAEVLTAGLARLVPDVLVDLVGQRVERLVGNDVVGLVTHWTNCRPSPPRVQSEAGAAGGRGGCSGAPVDGSRSAGDRSSRGRCGPPSLSSPRT